MATNAPCTKCWICGRPDQYRVVESQRLPGSPLVFGPTDWELVPHDHTQAEIDAWLNSIAWDQPKEKAMTTSVRVHVNGKYRATVKQDGRNPVTVEGNYNGGSGEKTFCLPHPAKATFEISEEQVKEGDERPA
jgi:hypothetical protein